MTSRIKGRHRRPSQAGRVICAGGTTTVTAGVIMAAATAGGAQAQAIHLPARSSSAYTSARDIMPGRIKTDSVIIVTVAPGNSLSQIAQDHCGSPADWTGIYDANDKLIGRNPNIIEPGQQLTLSCRIGWAPAPVVQETAAVQQPVRQAAYSAPAAAPAAVSTSGDGSFQSCVIARESGGSSQIMNSTGHYGLYQFSASTWAAYGGNPASFGDASVAEQDQVFDNAMATPGGAGNWAPYDGC